MQKRVPSIRVHWRLRSLSGNLAFKVQVELSWVSASHRGHSNHIFSRANNSGTTGVFFGWAQNNRAELKYSHSLMSIPLRLQSQHSSWRRAARSTRSRHRHLDNPAFLSTVSATRFKSLSPTTRFYSNISDCRQVHTRSYGTGFSRCCKVRSCVRRVSSRLQVFVKRSQPLSC